MESPVQIRPFPLFRISKISKLYPISKAELFSTVVRSINEISSGKYTTRGLRDFNNSELSNIIDVFSNPDFNDQGIKRPQRPASMYGNKGKYAEQMYRYLEQYGLNFNMGREKILGNADLLDAIADCLETRLNDKAAA